MSGPRPRDHGGDLDRAMAQYGGAPDEWIDLSTGINPVPYAAGPLPARLWERLPTIRDIRALEDAAKTFWDVPQSCEVVAASGASALIALLPHVLQSGSVEIPGPTYNEHAAAFEAAGWQSRAGGALVAVHPNNPDGRLWPQAAFDDHIEAVIDESFADVLPPELSHVPLSARTGHVVLKSFGKFWGLAGLRLGFAICLPDLARKIRARLGPWQVSGPAVSIGTRALSDRRWASDTRARLAEDAVRMDDILQRAGLHVLGGTNLFRLVRAPDAAALQRGLAEHRIWSRTFPYDAHWLRLGLPGKDDWARVEAAFAGPG